MAAVNFPNNPSVNDTHTSSGSTWKWDGGVWQRLGVAGPQGAQGVQGAVGAQGAAGSATISNNADNRVITGGSGTNLNGEASLTFDGNKLNVGTGATISSVGNVTAGIATFYGGATILGAVNIISGTNTNHWTFTAGGHLEPAFNNFFSIGDGNKQVNNIYANNLIAGGTVTIADSIVHKSDTNTKIRFPADDTITAETGGTERLRIDSAGRLLVKEGTNSTGAYGQYGTLQLKGNSTNTNAAILLLANGKNTTANSSGDHCGYIVFGDKQAGEYAYIRGTIDASPAVGDYPGRITFHTTADGAGSATERLRITSAGKVSISSDGTTDGLLTIKGDSDATTTPSIRLLDGGDTREVSITNQSGDFIASVHGTDNAAHGHIKMFESGIFQVSTGGASSSNTERLRITADGQVNIATTANYGTIGTAAVFQIYGNNAGGNVSQNIINHAAANASSTCDINIWQNYRLANRIVFGRENANNWQSSAAGAASFITFFTNSAGTVAERLRIDSKGTTRLKRADISNSAVTANNSALYLDIGDTEGSASYYQLIGFGYRSAVTNAKPAYIGYQSRTWSGHTYGDLVFGTRNNTTGSNEATEKVRIRASGQVQFSGGSFSDNVDCIMANGGTMEIGATGTIKLRTATNERFRIDSNGELIGYHSSGKILVNNCQRWQWGGSASCSSTWSVSIPPLTGGGGGNIYHIKAYFSHHSLSYGAYLEGVYGAYAGHTGLQIDVDENSSSSGAGGSWDVTRAGSGSNPSVVVTHTGGTYNGSGHWFVWVLAGHQ